MDCFGFEGKEAIEMPARKRRSATAEETVEKVRPVTMRRRRRAAPAGTNGHGLYNKARQRLSEADFMDTVEIIRDRATNMWRSGESEARKIASQLSLLSQMVKERWDEHRDLPWRTVAAFTVAIMYFIGPFDLIPDFIPFIGFLDDAAVLAFCFKLIQHDLRQYAEAEGIDLKAYGL
jgi:uncharacterized membrane protein YkvA (DUF1232 family)